MAEKRKRAERGSGSRRTKKGKITKKDYGSLGGEKEKTEEVLSERKGKGKNGAKETRGWKIERGFGSRKIRREKRK